MIKISELDRSIVVNQEQYKLYRKSLKNGEISLVKNSERTKVKQAFDELRENHNWSWYDEIYDRNKDNLDSIAIWYRGKEITYREMFENADKYIKTLMKFGFRKGDELPACLKNSPELIYLLLASSKTGIQLNLFGAGFDKTYITEILNKSNSKLLVAHELEYRKIKDAVDASGIETKYLIALSDSLDNKKDPYEEIDSQYIQFDSTIDELKENDDHILNSEEFIEYGADYICEDNFQCGIEDIFTITYTSGSTNSTRPSAIAHKTKSYITMGRFHGDDLSGLPSTKNMRGLVHIPTYSNTNLITCISDVFYQRGTITPEPVSDKKFFINSLQINQPCFAPATRCFYLELAKSIYFDDKYKDVKFPDLYIPTVVGEPLSMGEEKFINSALKKARAGVGKLPFPIAPVKVSFGGGDCEHGGLFFTLYREWMRRLSFSREEYGLTPFALTDLAVLRPDKSICALGELGKLASNSPCTMKEYKNNLEATEKFFIEDECGNQWGDNNVWAYLDKKKNVHMKGRFGKDFYLEDGTIYPAFLISENVLRDTKNILSCEVVTKNDEIGNRVIAVHVEFYPTTKKKGTQILESIDQRLIKSIPAELHKDIVYRVHSREESFALNGSGKRDVPALRRENIGDNYLKLIKQPNNYQILYYTEYQNMIASEKDRQFIKE